MSRPLMSPFNRRPANLILLFLTAVSLFGLVFAALITVNPPTSQDGFVWRKPVVGLAFASVCVLGALAVFYPNECSKSFNFGKVGKSRSGFHSFKRDPEAHKSDSSVLRGHHPMCGRFSSHVFNLGSRMFCATCSGLFLGAVIVLVGVAAYFFGNWQIGQNASLSIWAGILGVTVGLLQPLLLRVQRSFVRVFSGALLAVGTLLILAAVDELVRNVFLDIFLIFLTVFWLLTRISFSQWEHEKMCSTCSLAFCNFAEETKK